MIAKSEGVMLIVSISIIFCLMNFRKIMIDARIISENTNIRMFCQIGSSPLCRADSDGQLEGLFFRDFECS